MIWKLGMGTESEMWNILDLKDFVFLIWILNILDLDLKYIADSVDIRMGVESKMWNILDLKDLVFGARDIDNDLMIKQDSSYIIYIMSSY